jgi:hypothetical protein
VTSVWGPLFDGPTYEPTLDEARLTGQLERVWGVMRDGRWHTLAELVERCGGTTASVSARLRDLRKPRFGSHAVGLRRTHQPGVWEYKVSAAERVA